jgi:hypothetical protein
MKKTVCVSSIHGGGLVGAGSLWLTQFTMAMMLGLNVRGVTGSSTKNKTLKIKIKNENPAIKSTRQMKTQVDTTPKKKPKKTINKN